MGVATISGKCGNTRDHASKYQSLFKRGQSFKIDPMRMYSVGTFHCLLIWLDLYIKRWNKRVHDCWSESIVWPIHPWIWFLPAVSLGADGEYTIRIQIGVSTKTERTAADEKKCIKKEGRNVDDFSRQMTRSSTCRQPSKQDSRGQQQQPDRKIQKKGKKDKSWKFPLNKYGGWCVCGLLYFLKWSKQPNNEYRRAKNKQGKRLVGTRTTRTDW